jgi:RNA polymerase sigma-70 factor (ECF subfamily)
MTDVQITNDMQATSRTAYHAFIDLIVPFRPELHRYCRKLTGDIWDAEDLVQDTLLKGFATLGLKHGTIENPRGYLVRIATNLWIDAQRHRAVAAQASAREMASATASVQAPSDQAGARHAAEKLIAQLAPQERAAIVLKDVFDMSLKECAEILSTSENAVKAALHRGRERLQDETAPHTRAASPALVAKFVKCLDASDLPGLLALMLDTGSIDMGGTLVENGRAEFERKGCWLWQAVNVHPDLPKDMRPPKWVNEIVTFRGETIVLGFMPPAHGHTLQGITRFEDEDGRIARIRSYCFSPETAAEVAAELGLKVGWIPYRFPTMPKAST